VSAAGVDAEADWEAAFLALGETLRSTFRAISRRRGRDTHLGGSEMSYAQFELLLELGDRGELAAGELAAVAHLTPATVTQMLDRLAESGHVERARSERDRRVVVSRLTPEGLRLVEAKRAYWRERWEGALTDFSSAEMRTATAVLDRLLTIFEGDSERVGRGSDGE
jgi:DNA-binding MarR family transcriptional regulator